MDGLLNKGKEMLNKAGNSSGGAPQGGDPNAQQAGNAGAGQEDYGDKGNISFLSLFLTYTTPHL